MRVTHLTFVSAAAMTISGALVYSVTPAGGVAGVARADVELASAGRLEPDSDWVRGEVETGLPGSTAAPAAIVTGEPAIAPPLGTAVVTRAPAGATSSRSRPAHRAPKAEPAFVPEPSARPTAIQAPRKPLPSVPQQAAFPQQAALPAPSAFPSSTSSSFGSKK